MKIQIRVDVEGERLDKFLTEKLSDKTRSQIQKLIKAGAILVNDEVKSVHYFLKIDDVIKIGDIPTVAEELKIEDVDSGILVEPQVIAETNDYLVINKPAGLMVHPAEGVSEKTLVDWLMKKYPTIAKVGEDPMRPGIVHRLDKEVSGLMVIAKNQNFFDIIKEQFQKRTVKKTYIALVYGQIEKETDEINFPIDRSSDGHKMVAIPATVKGDANERGKRAITNYFIRERFINYTFLDVDILTGRTHQIRVHMTAFGHPIVGDDMYSTKTTREKNKRANLGRIFLVSRRLSFVDGAGQVQEFNIELPKDLQKFLEEKVR